MVNNIVEMLLPTPSATLHLVHAARGEATNTVTITPWLARKPPIRLPQLLRGSGSSLTVSPAALAGVGRTSYGIKFFIRCADGTPLARVSTVMVNVSEDDTTSTGAFSRNSQRFL